MTFAIERSIGLSSYQLVSPADKHKWKGLNLSKISYGLPVLASTSCTSDSVNVADHALGEIVVDDQIYAFEINSSTHEVSANEDPRITLPKIANYFVTFALRSIRMYDVHIYTLIQKFLKSV
jgi:hypothetical protein